MPPFPTDASLDVLEAEAPRFTISDAERVASEEFRVEVEDASPLDSERDQNFRLRTADDRELVLKIGNQAEDPAVVDFQNRALKHVAERDPELPIPRLIPTPSGEHGCKVDGPDGQKHLVRLLTFLPGKPLGDLAPENRPLRSLGATVARLGLALRGFFHPAAGHRLLWDLKHAASLREHVVHIEDAGRRELADHYLRNFEKRALPQLPGLRAQVIHNDVSPNNALVDPSGGNITGVVDFGDLVHAPLVNDVAVSLFEVILDAPDPVATAAEFLDGYCAVEPLRREERDLLFDLGAARLAVAVAILAWRVKSHPENRSYIEGGKDELWALLERLDELEPELRGVLLGAQAPRSASVESDTSLVERRTRLLGPALSHFYDRPLHAVRGSGAWLIDSEGRAHLDAYNNVPQVGHCHPTVVEAIARQAATLNTNTRYLSRLILDYAERLIATLPGDLSVCMFVCSGSEANDLAWRLAKLHTGNEGALVVAHSYFGTTDAVNDLSVSELPPGQEPAPHVRTVPAPDDYRGPHRRGEPDLGERYAAYADDAIASLAADGLAPAAFFADYSLSSSGILVPPPGYLPGIYARVRAAGGLCVADEVQSGFGRTGEHLWGFEAQGVVPDIVTFGKPIGNGHPMAALVTTPAIANSLAARGSWFSTLGGNPVSCAAGLAVLDVIEREGLQENAKRMGTRLRSGLESLAARHALIGDVRGAGLFVGVDLVRNRETREPATRETHAAVEHMREGGVLVATDGPHGNVIKIRPPLVFGEAEVDRVVDALDRALAEIA
jgi:4-aminobutyrate aminotransferase-like enzyme/Ser/Thr protein kinase RdoA (MazF antagonist)